MAKKKSKKKKSPKEEQEKDNVPIEWVGKSVDQLKELVDQLQNDLEKAQKSRNMAQTELASIISFSEVTKEHIQELEMRIEKEDLKVENIEDDNENESKVYEQKSTFIKYCHDKKLKQKKDDIDSRTKGASADHIDQVNDALVSNAALDDERNELEKRFVDEFSRMSTQKRDELSHVREQLHADVRLFEKQCVTHHSLVMNELETRRTSALHDIESRKKSHLEDIMSSHERACGEIRSYFDGVERKQSIDIEELQAQIRRLKTIAAKNESNSNNLKERNMIHGEDLQLCSHKVSNLKTLTKDKEKDRISLNAATARLSTTRRSIKESRDEYKKLQNNVEFIREEIDKVKSNMKALNEKPDEHLAIVANAAKRKDLKLSIEKQQLKNDISELHLSHIIASAGLSGEESNALSTTIGDFVTEKNKETETLTLKIAKMKHNYLSMLMDRGVSAGDVKSIEVEKNK